MAITLNGGTGVITGVSVGGLPDGCVANDDLAGSIADGKITGLTASKLTGALPAISGASLTGISGGKVLQVVQTVTNTQIVNTTDPSDVDLMSVSITPSATSSKILIMMTWFEGASNPNGAYRLLRDSTSLGDASSSYDGGTGFASYDDSAVTNDYMLESKTFTFLDSPSTTSAITYKLSTHSSAAVYFNTAKYAANGHATSTITVMEIGA